MAGLDLDPSRSAPAGGVRRGEVLDDDALVPGGDQLVEERLRLLRVGGHPARDEQGLRGDRLQPRETLAGRQVDQVVAVEVQHVEEVRRERDLRAQPRDVQAARRAGRGLLEGARPASVVQRDGLAVEDEGLALQREHRLDHLGQPVGDLVEAAGEEAHLAVAAVGLDPDAVELAVHDGAVGSRGPAGPRRRPGPRPQHRAHRAADHEADGLQARDPARQRGDRSGPGMPGEHHGAAHGRLGHVGGGGDRLEHHAVEGALAHLAGDQPAQEVLLGCGGPGEERLHRGGPRGGGADAAQGSDGLQPAVHHGQRQGGRGGRRGQRPEAAPAHADAPLREDPGEVGRGRGHLLGSRRTQGAGQRLDLRGARPGGGGGRGDGHQLAQEHGRPAVTRARPPGPPTPCRGPPRRVRR